MTEALKGFPNVLLQILVSTRPLGALPPLLLSDHRKCPLQCPHYVSALLFLLPAKGQKQRDVSSALAPCLLVNWKEGEASSLLLLLFKGLWGHSIKGEELSLFNF